MTDKTSHTGKMFLPCLLETRKNCLKLKGLFVCAIGNAADEAFPMTLMPFVGLLALLLVMLCLMKSLLHSFEQFFLVFTRQGRKAKELFFSFYPYD